MKYVDLTLPSAAANLACDEALLDLCEDGLESGILRFWESSEHFVVIGYANRAAVEVNLAACSEDNVRVLRRVSGGGTVLQGPGCLNYSLILPIKEGEPLASITGANRFILERQKSALNPLLGGAVKIQGQTDLALDNLKFSGNAQRRKRHALIFHGTFLLQFDFALIEKYLLMPSKQPEYRAGRQHGQFLVNLALDSKKVKQAIRNEWQAIEELSVAPTEKINSLTATKYSTNEWNLRC